MAGARRPNQQRPNQPRDNGYGAPRNQGGYGNDATFKMMGGQLTVGNKSGARSWLGTPESDTMMPGVHTALAPMGQAKNGFQQFGYVPDAEPGQAGYQQSGRTPYAAEGMGRAGFVTPNGWDPKGKANTQTYNSMQTAIAGGNVGTGGHLELGQKGQDTGHGARRPNARGQNSPGGMPGGPNGIDPGFNKGGGPSGQIGGKPGGGGKPGNRRPRGAPNKGLPNMPPGVGGGVGQMPQMPTPPANFLPMTPGYEQDWRGLNDQLSAAEGQFAQGQAMLPAMYNQQNVRLQNDQNVATDKLKEDLAARGIYTAKNAAGEYGGTSPAGGGVGESLYGRNVATPYGREFQDLAAQQAGAYQDLYGQYAGANLGYAQGINQALLNRANEAYELDPMGLANSGYEVPDMADPYFPFAPTGRPTTGARKRRPGSNKKTPPKKRGKK